MTTRQHPRPILPAGGLVSIEAALKQAGILLPSGVFTVPVVRTQEDKYHSHTQTVAMEHSHDDNTSLKSDVMSIMPVQQTTGTSQNNLVIMEHLSEPTIISIVDQTSQSSDFSHMSNIASRPVSMNDLTFSHQHGLISMAHQTNPNQSVSVSLLNDQNGVISMEECADQNQHITIDQHGVISMAHESGHYGLPITEDQQGHTFNTQQTFPVSHVSLEPQNTQQSIVSMESLNSQNEHEVNSMIYTNSVVYTESKINQDQVLSVTDDNTQSEHIDYEYNSEQTDIHNNIPERLDHHTYSHEINSNISDNSNTHAESTQITSSALETNDLQTSPSSVPVFTDFISIKTVGNKTFNSNPWKCCYRPCEKLFATEDNLSRHILLKHITQAHRCKYCCKLLPSETDYEIHVECHLDQEFCDDWVMTIPDAELNLSYTIPPPLTFLKVFTCKTCEQNFTSSEDLTHHSAFHNKNFKCNSCEKSYGSQATLTIHSYSHRESKPFSCLKCPKRFHSQSHLVHHEQTHEQESYEFKCLYCEKSYQQQSALRVHVFYNHFDFVTDCLFYKTPSTGKQLYLTWRDAQHFKCSLCHKPFAKKLDLQRHNLDRCRRINQFSCVNCPRKFRSTAERDEHESSQVCTKQLPIDNCDDLTDQCIAPNTQMGNNDLKITNPDDVSEQNDTTNHCPKCDKNFESLKALSEHQTQPCETVQTDALYSCGKCGLYFSSLLQFTEHKSTHWTVKPCFPCPHCDEQFTNRMLLKRHVFYRHFDGVTPCLYYKCSLTSKESFLTRVDASKNICSFCGNVFLKLAELLKHKRDVHEDKPKSFSCNECVAQFATSSQLKVHVLSHAKERAFTCTICNVSCTTRSSLASHMVVHSHRKPYQCTYCGKTFARSMQVKRHTLIHTGERNHACTICSKRFPTLTDVKKHAVTHNTVRDRPFNCQYCDKSYLKKSNLNTHILSHFHE